MRSNRPGGQSPGIAPRRTRTFGSAAVRAAAARTAAPEASQASTWPLRAASIPVSTPTEQPGSNTSS
jgi:hypothetical protein